ncbi:unnamed protein product [Tenebrio molitor]|nr:unnamed protein product [Tenebrio molitor]
MELDSRLFSHQKPAQLCDKLLARPPGEIPASKNRYQ